MVHGSFFFMDSECELTPSGSVGDQISWRTQNKHKSGHQQRLEGVTRSRAAAQDIQRFSLRRVSKNTQVGWNNWLIMHLLLINPIITGKKLYVMNNKPFLLQNPQRLLHLSLAQQQNRALCCRQSRAQSMGTGPKELLVQATSVGLFHQLCGHHVSQLLWRIAQDLFPMLSEPPPPFPPEHSFKMNPFETESAVSSLHLGPVGAKP